MQYLETLADSNTPTGLFFESFRVPGCYAVGCKLFGTPWTDQNLAVIDGTFVIGQMVWAKSAVAPPKIEHSRAQTMWQGKPPHQSRIWPITIASRTATIFG